MSLHAFIRLLKSYRDTRYLFTADGLEYEVRIDERNPIAEAWLRRMGAPGGVFLSAMNPKSELRPVEQNSAAAARLEEDVRRRGFAVFPHLGQGLLPEWPPERGVMALGMPEPEAVEVAEQFGQNAIVSFGADRPGRLVLTRVMLSGFGLAPIRASEP